MRFCKVSFLGGDQDIAHAHCQPVLSEPSVSLCCRPPEKLLALRYNDEVVPLPPLHGGHSPILGDRSPAIESPGWEQLSRFGASRLGRPTMNERQRENAARLLRTFAVETRQDHLAGGLADGIGVH